MLFCWTEYYTSHQDNYYDTVYTIQRLMDNIIRDNPFTVTLFYQLAKCSMVRLTKSIFIKLCTFIYIRRIKIDKSLIKSTKLLRLKQFFCIQIKQNDVLCRLKRASNLYFPICCVVKII